jgi:hypothetical protein
MLTWQVCISDVARKETALTNIAVFVQILKKMIIGMD